MICFRGEKYLSKKLEKEVKTIISLYLRLEEINNTTKYYSFPLDIPLYDFSKSRIEEAAHLTREILGIKNAIVFDLFNLLESNGLRIVSMSLPLKLNGFSYYNYQKRTITFFVNSNDSIERKIFTLAHELGHVIFHQGGAKYNVYMPESNIEDLEKAATYFASCFLMPEFAVRQTLIQLGLTKDKWNLKILLSLKARFSVSAESFLYRLTELELINPEIKERLKKEIHVYYKKTGYMEPSPANIVLNENKRLKDLIEIGKNFSIYKTEAISIAKSLKQVGVRC